MFSKYYQNELGYLRSTGKEFAARNSLLAGLLAERGGDPDVERLLEGFAFLTARIRERIDDCVPEIVHDLTEMLLPHQLRPLPASSIVEFTPTPGVLRARAKVRRDTELQATSYDGTGCRFRTSADVDLLPVSVQEVLLDQSLGSSPRIRVQIQAAQAALPALLHPDGVRFFLHGELPLASTLLLWFSRHLVGVQVRGIASGSTATLPATAVRPVGFDPSLPLLPWPAFAPRGYRHVQEYFALPQKFLFFELRGLDAVAFREEKLEIAFQFDRPPELPARIGKENLKTNCVPVVNLFKGTSDPISIGALGEEHLIRAADHPPEHMEVYSVDAAVGIPDGPGDRVIVDPFFEFAHGTRGVAALYYRLRRRHSPVDDGTDTWLSLTKPLDGGAGADPATLSLDLTCTNRSLPGRIQIGEIAQPTAASPTVARFRNIVAVTKPVRPPVGSELHWRLLAHLAATRSALSDAQALRTMLDLYNIQAVADQQTGRANRLRIEGIAKAGATSTRRLLEGAPVRGTRVDVELDEARFAGPGDAFLFASVMDELLAARASLNVFSELSVRLSPSQREFGFAARNGGRVLA
ncbi:MAG: type VI secretion system baseplate subunit TssF [Myxococcales bacterium]